MYLGVVRTLGALSVVAALVTTSPAQAADPDPWIAEDKALHAVASGALASATYAAGAALLDARGHALLAAAGITLAIGAGKEALDAAGVGHPSWRDFTWDCIGAAAGLALAWSVDLLVRGVGPRRPLFARPIASGLVLRF